MIDITTQNFELELIQASLQQPVLLDIWAPWCGPCKALGPALEKLEVAYAGRFRLAKLNADDEPQIAGQLSQMFGVRSIPFCVMFKDGQPVDGFVGALPEEELRAFLDKHVPSPDEALAAEDVADAGSLLAEGDTASALEKLQEAVALDPAHEGARANLLQALLKLGRLADARAVYAPVATQVLPHARLSALGHWLAACEAAQSARSPAELSATITTNRRDFDARLELAQCLFAAERHTEAMDELLEIVMRDKKWRDELPRKTVVAILELMSKPAPAKPEASTPKSTLEIAGKVNTQPADPVVDQYRRKLSMALN